MDGGPREVGCSDTSKKSLLSTTVRILNRLASRRRPRSGNSQPVATVFRLMVMRPTGVTAALAFVLSIALLLCVGVGVCAWCGSVFVSVFAATHRQSPFGHYGAYLEQTCIEKTTEKRQQSASQQSASGDCFFVCILIYAQR